MRRLALLLLGAACATAFPRDNPDIYRQLYGEPAPLPPPTYLTATLDAKFNSPSTLRVCARPHLSDAGLHGCDV